MEPAPVPAGASAYRVQVAAVRSRRDADELVARLQQEHRAKLGQRVPVVDEAVFGNMGTFYRVRLGPFADAGEPSRLCATLNASGFDCLVLAQ
jgi:cell division septation protein DedD